MSCTNRMEHLCPFTRINDAIKILFLYFITANVILRYLELLKVLKVLALKRSKTKTINPKYIYIFNWYIPKSR